ncbi:MAG: quinolinate synthase [Gemmatimonas sp.]|nr:quinolinate synthase [Gemmatimonas sp.]
MNAPPHAPVPTGQELVEAILELRRGLNAVILAHYYQQGEIQDLADFVGDSLQLSQVAARTEAEVIVFAGVHFMAETAKILNPGRQVLLPDLDAGCSLADGCPPDAFRAFLDRHPGHAVVSYINCSAATKAMSDIICTSSNAVRVVDSIPRDRPVVFAPDRHLGAWVSRQLGRDLVLWPGSCEVHEQFSERRLVELKTLHPGAEVLAHPECTEALLRHADRIGSTTALLGFAGESRATDIIVLTEPGILHRMRRENPGKTFWTVPGADESCSCNECPYMKRNTLEKLYLCLRDRAPEIVVPEDLRVAALRPIERMLALG